MKSTLLRLQFLAVALFFLFLSPTRVYGVEFQWNGEIKITDYLYDQLDRYYGPPVERSNYFLQRTTLNGSVQSGVTTGIFRFYLNDLTPGGDEPTGGYIWGSTGGFGSPISIEPGIREAYLEFAVPFNATLDFGHKVLKVGHGIILNDMSDNVFLTIPYSIFKLNLAYIKVKEADSVNNGNADDFDTNGYLIDIVATFDDTDSLELFYTETKEQNPTGFDLSDNDALVLGIAANGRAGIVDWTGEYDQISGFDGNYLVNLPRVGVNFYLSGSVPFGFGRAGVDLLYIKGNRSNSEVSYNSIAGDFVGGRGILLNSQNRYNGGIDLNSGMADLVDPTPAGYWSILSHHFTSVKGYIEFNPFHRLSLVMEVFPSVTVIEPAVLGLQHGDIGMEGNMTGIYPLDDHLKLIAGVAYLKAGNALREIAATTNTPGFAQNITKTQISLLWTF
jgi:hypothetical protein